MLELCQVIPKLSKKVGLQSHNTTKCIKKDKCPPKCVTSSSSREKFWHRRVMSPFLHHPCYGINLIGISLSKYKNIPRIFLLILDRKRVDLYGFLDLGKTISCTPRKDRVAYLVSEGCSYVSWLLQLLK
jgi:hypothetical protein